MSFLNLSWKFAKRDSSFRAKEFVSDDGRAMASSSVASENPTQGWDSQAGKGFEEGHPQAP